MRRIHLFLGFMGVAVVSTVLVIGSGLPASVDRSSTPASDEAEDQMDSSRSTEVLTHRPVTNDDTRETVALEQEVDDPCASLADELEAERGNRALAEQEVARLREALAALNRELNALKFPEDTPYGAFLASAEAEDITDPELRKDIKAWLDAFPVFLRTGEATWIAEREVASDWRAFGRSAQHALVYFLGPERLATEMSMDKLFEDLLYDEDYGPALQAALPREKRANLKAKLHGLLEKSDDPEEIAWLLEKFPTFFD